MKVLDVSPICVSEVHKSSKELDVIKTGVLNITILALWASSWQTLVGRREIGLFLKTFVEPAP
jgi:hypothetical protein